MRTWLITGCATGFGALLAQTLLDRGERVVATDRSAPALAHLRAPHPDRLLTLPLDVTDDAQIEHAIAAAVGSFGRIDVLVNNAGLGLGGPFEEVSLERVRQLFAVNVIGLMAVTRAVLPQLRAQGNGRVINLSSDSGLVGWRFQAVYGATKHAVEGFSESLAFEVAPFGIDVVLIEPCGFFATPLPASAISEAVSTLRADSPYRRAVEATLGGISDRMAEAQDPRLVVDAIMAAAEDPRPSLRRPVGQRDRVDLIAMRRRMPDEEFLALIRSNT
jgi:NAD(P)-dependent dehydrogenase (short-subunit alcohol dehydrogenase family)